MWTSRTFFALALLLLAVICQHAAVVAGHRIDVPAGKSECFFEDLHKQDEVSAIGRASITSVGLSVLTFLPGWGFNR